MYNLFCSQLNEYMYMYNRCIRYFLNKTLCGIDTCTLFAHTVKCGYIYVCVGNRCIRYPFNSVWYRYMYTFFLTAKSYIHNYKVEAVLLYVVSHLKNNSQILCKPMQFPLAIYKFQVPGEVQLPPSEFFLDENAPAGESNVFHVGHELNDKVQVHLMFLCVSFCCYYTASLFSYVYMCHFPFL